MSIASKLIEEGRRKGRVEGRAEGREEGTREALLHVLTARFGPPADDARDRIAVAEPRRIKEWLARAAVAASVDEALATE